MTIPKFMYLTIGKRVFDFSAALIGLVILAVPMVVIAILIWVTCGRPILFTQDRVGKDGKIFRIRKFRTMTVRQSNVTTITVAGDQRITAPENPDNS